MKHIILRAAGSILAASTLGVGVASAQGFIGPTGPFSTNEIRRFDDRNSFVRNTNNVVVNNWNNQFARSGDALVAGNTLGGSAITGNASNFNSTATNIGIRNSDWGSGFDRDRFGFGGDRFGLGGFGGGFGGDWGSW